MKFKAFIIAASMACACTAQAQDINSIPNLDLEEDSTGVASVSDIVKCSKKFSRTNKQVNTLRTCGKDVHSSTSVGLNRK